VVLTLLCDLAFQGWFCDWRTDVVSDKYVAEPEHAHKYVQLLDESHQRMLPLRGASGTADELPPCISRNWNVPSASGYSPIMLKRYADLTTMTEGGFLMLPWHFTVTDRTFDILAIKYIFAPQGDQHLVDLTEHGLPVFKKVETAGNADVFENRRAFPRCWLANSVVVLRPDEIVNTIKSSTLPDGRAFLPDSMALVEEAIPEMQSSTPSKSTTSSSSSIAAIAPDRISIRTDNQSARLLVLSDTYYPGWKATVDDKDVPIHQTDYVLRGIFVPAGKHTVALNYRPTSLLIGAALCALCIVGLTGLNVLSRVRKSGKGVD